MMNRNNDGTSGNAVPYESPFIPSSLAWMGGSLFSSLQSNDVKFITLKDLMEQYQSIAAQNFPSRGDEMTTKLVEKKGGNAKQEEQDNYRIIREKQFDLFKHVDLLEAPDWLSTDEKDWTFFGPHKSIQT